jgi:hypothetical protein
MTKLYPTLGDSRGLLGLMSRELMIRCARNYWSTEQPIAVEIPDLVPLAVFITAANSNLQPLEESIDRLGHRMNQFIKECMSYPM